MAAPRRLVLLLAVCSLRALAAAEEVACSTDINNKDGSSRGVELKLTLTSQRPVAISFRGYSASGEVGGAYFCQFTASAANHRSVWTEANGAVAVTIPAGDGDDQDPTNESSFEISPTKDGYLVTFASMSRTYCGFGAEFPDGVRLVRGRKACKVTFPG